MQRDHRLAGTGSTFDDENSIQGAANNAILISLNGGDDIAHPTSAVPTQGGQQGSFTGQLGLIDGPQIEHVVVDPDNAPV